MTTHTGRVGTAREQRNKKKAKRTQVGVWAVLPQDKPIALTSFQPDCRSC